MMQVVPGTEYSADIVMMKFGSHLYGLDTPESDVDYKGIFLPKLPELLLENSPKIISTSTGNSHSKNTSKDKDFDLISLPRFIKDACDGETYTIDMLHSKEKGNFIWEYLVQNRTDFYCKNMKAYIGYVKQQAAKYGIKGSKLHDIKCAIDKLKECNPDMTLEGLFWFSEDPVYLGTHARIVDLNDGMYYEVNNKKYKLNNKIGYIIDGLQKMYDGYGHRAKLAEKNEGIDWKAISHALRAGYQVRSIFLDGDFEYPLKETPFLREVKLGKLHYKDEVNPVLENLVDEINHLSEISKLPSKVNRKRWVIWLLKLYERMYGVEIDYREDFNLNV